MKLDNIKKRINSFLRDKKVFITISQNLNIIFGKKYHVNFEDYEISNYSCYLDISIVSC